MKAREILNQQEPTVEKSPTTIDESTEEFGWNPRAALTIRALHRLRLICELQRLEAEKQRKFVAHMYGDNFDESDEKETDSRTPPKSVKPPKPFKPLEPSSKYLDKYKRS